MGSARLITLVHGLGLPSFKHTDGLDSGLSGSRMGAPNPEQEPDQSVFVVATGREWTAGQLTTDQGAVVASSA
jgi:hypothetical protein